MMNKNERKMKRKNQGKITREENRKKENNEKERIKVKK